MISKNVITMSLQYPQKCNRTNYRLPITEELARNLIEEESEDTEMLSQQQLTVRDNFPDNVSVLPQEEAGDKIQPRRGK